MVASRARPQETTIKHLLQPGNGGAQQAVDKSQPTRAEPKRRRDIEHLKYVATHPCMVCGRQPAQAHHLTVTQPNASGSKVSDEFTVPLCSLHHRSPAPCR
jgi:hypothetical protein